MTYNPPELLQIGPSWAIDNTGTLEWLHGNKSPISPDGSDADRVRYVSLVGDDANSGLTRMEPMRWVQTAIDDLASLGGGEVRVGGGEHVHEWVWPANVSVIGAGKRLTTFKAVSGSTNLGVITLEPGQIISGRLAHFGVVGNGNAGQHGIYLKAAAQASSPFDGGLWFSRMEHLFVWQFSGEAIWFRAGGNLLLPHQFIVLDHLEVYATTTGRALRLSGQCGQLNVINGNYDGPGKGLGVGENILVQREVNDAGAAISDVAPYTVNLYGVTCQSAKLGARIERADNVNFDGCYFEELWQGVSYDVSVPKGEVARSRFANVFRGDGTGYHVRAANTSRVATRGNYYLGTVERSTFNDGGWIEAKGDHEAGGLYRGAGHTKELVAAATLTLDYGSTFLVHPSATPITTINSNKAPGEAVYLKGWFGTGTVSLAEGGNIELGGRASPVVLDPREVATLVRFDHAGGGWSLVAVSNG